MGKRRLIVNDGPCEVEVVTTPDGTFRRSRYTNYVNARTGWPEKGRWSPWMSEATMEAKEPTYLAQS